MPPSPIQAGPRRARKVNCWPEGKQKGVTGPPETRLHVSAPAAKASVYKREREKSPFLTTKKEGQGGGYRT